MERQPPFPELIGCKAGGGGDYCALLGCFYEKMKGRIDSSVVGVEQAEEMLEQIDSEAKKTGCAKT